MRTSKLWIFAWMGIGGGVVAAISGTLTGSELGSMLAGYGILSALAGAYLGAGLVIRDRVRRSTALTHPSPEHSSMLGRRVF
jgi:hypothetical protein